MMETTMNKSGAIGLLRLSRLEQVIRMDVDPKTFEMYGWVGYRVDVERFGVPEKLTCGTHACAVGQGAYDPILRAAGLRLGASGQPTYRRLHGWEAVEEFFHIDNKTAAWLFDAASYPNHKQRGKRAILAVANRIREYITEQAKGEAYDPR